MLIWVRNIQRTYGSGAKIGHFCQNSTKFSQTKCTKHTCFWYHNKLELKLPTATYYLFKVSPNKRMRKQCRDRNQGRFLQNFQNFKVVWFNNFFVLSQVYKYVISFSCSFSTLYNICIRVKSFRFSFIA